MIARSLFLFLLLIILPDLYFDLHYWRHRLSLWKRIACWLPSIGLIVYTLVLSAERNFIPENPTILYIYLLLLGLIVIPKFVYLLCSVTGLCISRLLHRKNSLRPARNYGNLLGIVLMPVLWWIVIYGAFIGFQELKICHETYICKDIPDAFNGYKIVQFSDSHVGTYTGSSQQILKKAVDCINAQHADLIVFTGDLQNIHPQEIYKQMDILSSLKAKDGVYSVLGNHDYAQYVECDEAQKVANCRETVSLEKQLGWNLLLNEHRTIQRGKDQIVIAGMENDGDGIHFPQKGDIGKTLPPTVQNSFILMLEHDPSAWRRKIVPDGRAQLTLSGHTHAAQFMIGSWSPLALTGREWYGWYKEGAQSLYVSSGLGGVIPFRFGATGEIVIITLRNK